MRRQITGAALAVLLAAGCGGADEDTRAEAADERAEAPSTTWQDVPAVDPDTVGWIQRGETLEWGGRTWIMVGQPIESPILRHVGEAEGMQLYALPDPDPALQLFFHLGNDRWQTLEPVSGAATPAGGTTPRDTAARGDAATPDTAGQRR